MTAPNNMPLSERLLRLAHAGEVPRPQEVIWAPDYYPLEVVASATESVLSDPSAPARDFSQAAYLLTTFLRAGQYVPPAQESEQ